MARGGNIRIKVDYTAFNQSIRAALDHVDRGTRKATVAACEEIEQATLAQVPRLTNTLAESFSYEVDGYRRNFTANIGYAIKKDPVNPHTGTPASQYMVAVHENLDAVHVVGKAKFFEDPIREYRDKFPGKLRDLVADELGTGG